MNMAQLVVGLVLLVVLMNMVDHSTQKRRCPYCGEVKGHGQDCPYDFDQRGLGR